MMYPAVQYTRPVALLVALGCLANLAAAKPPVTALAVAPDGKSVAVGSQAGIEILAFPSLTFKRRFATELLHVHDLEFSANGDKLAAVGGVPGESGTIELLHWPSGRLLQRVDPHKDIAFDIAWGWGEQDWATASADRSVYVQADDPLRLRGHSRGVRAVVYLGDGKHLVSAGLDHSLRIWSLPEGRIVRAMDNHKAPIVDLAIRPTGDGLPTVASASEDKTVRIWQPTIGRLVRFARLPIAPLAIDWTPDGARLLAACRDGRVRIIDPATVEIVADIPAISGWAYSVAALPNGEDFVVGGERGQLRVLPIRLLPRDAD